MQHFKANNLFSENQYGFIKGRSTNLQLLSVLDKWTNDLEHGGQIAPRILQKCPWWRKQKETRGVVVQPTM